jgi:hypothetical protein
MYRVTAGGATPNHASEKSFLINVDIPISSNSPFRRITDASAPVKTLIKLFAFFIL